MKTGNPYKDGFLAIAEDYRRLLSERGEAFITQVANSASMRGVLGTVYSILREAGRLTPIEDLSPDEKQELWGEAVRQYRGGDKETRVQVCKAYHALGVYCQLMNGHQ